MIREFQSVRLALIAATCALSASACAQVPAVKASDPAAPAQPAAATAVPQRPGQQVQAIRAYIEHMAMASGLVDQPDVRAQLAFARQTVLIRAVLTQYLQQHPVTQAQIQARYDAERNAYGPIQVHVAQIFVGSKGAAEDAIKRLRAGRSFADVARKMSRDIATAKNGGDVGWVSPNQLLVPIRLALEQMKPGEYTATPVRSARGWHVVELEGRRPAPFPTFDAAKVRIEQQLQKEELDRYMAQLAAESGVKSTK